MSVPSQSEIFLGRQPILDSRRRVFGYELLFRSCRGLSANVSHDVGATAAVITRTMNLFGFDAAVGKHLGFINISRELLMSDVLELLPNDRVVLELLETIKVDESVLERCRDLKARGFRLALDDFRYDESYEPLFEIVDIIKFDVTLSTIQEIKAALRRLHRHRGLRLLAEKVEDVRQFEQFKTLGFHLFQGYFFARPTILSGREISPSQSTLLQILGQTMSDIEISEIERTFKQSPDLIIGLLRLVNSAGMGLREKIGSVQQALVLLGRRQLQRWVQLLLYAQNDSGDSNPLLQLAATRARTMELLNQWHARSPGDTRADHAFIVGIMSLADVVLGLKIDDIVGQIDLVDEVKEALLRHEGFFGHMLSLVEKVEAGDFVEASDLLSELGITPTELNNAQIEAMEWAATLNRQSATA
jgi:EAL and modified HD-GYP domain-containing signal transduction protein